MDLAQHAAVLWRFRAVLAAGLALGVLLAVLAAFQVPSFSPRGSETWTSESSLLITQAGGPEFRTLAGAPDAAAPSGDTGDLEFADPDRLSALASLYAQLATGDRVRRQLPEKPKPAQIEAIALEGNASTQLPVVKLTTEAGSGPAARALNEHTVDALQNVVRDEQSRNAIPAGQRIRIDQINAPADPVKTAGRSHTASILAFLLCALGAVALAHLLAALRDGREDMQEVEGVVVPWTSDPEPVPAPEPMHAHGPAPDTMGWLSGRRQAR
ncbi:MAG: hypothetical protein JW895_08570 [Thermoleophilaceae bacterium]|nr:hypothetical protein [Thermoleophilaceae bacterium]